MYLLLNSWNLLHLWKILCYTSVHSSLFLYRAGGIFSGTTVQPDSTHLWTGRVPHVPEGEGWSATPSTLPQDRWTAAPVWIIIKIKIVFSSISLSSFIFKVCSLLDVESLLLRSWSGELQWKYIFVNGGFKCWGFVYFSFLPSLITLASHSWILCDLVNVMVFLMCRRWSCGMFSTGLWDYHREVWQWDPALFTCIA